MLVEYIGSEIVIEVELEKYTPFGVSAAADPDSVLIDIYDSANTQKVTAASMIWANETGKWYYVVQTTSLWIAGKYKAIITIQENTEVNKKTVRNLFKLQ